MVQIPTFSFVLFAFALFSCSVYAQDSLKADRVILLDTYNLDNCQNLLFRSNKPLDSDDNFAYDTLYDYMRDEAKSRGVDMPKQYFLQVFNLMRDSGEEGDYSKTENEYFHDHPSEGAIIQNPIEGTDKEAPSHYSNKEVKKYVSNWNKYFEDQNFDQFIDTIRESVTHECRVQNGNEFIPTVTLVHCNHGRDRAGQVSGSYLMKYAGWNFPEVSALNYQVGGLDSPIVFSNQRAMVWYCQYLVEEQGFSMKKLKCNDEENMSSGDESVPEYLDEVSSIAGSASSLVYSFSLSLFVLAVSFIFYL